MARNKNYTPEMRRAIEQVQRDNAQLAEWTAFAKGALFSSGEEGVIDSALDYMAHLSQCPFPAHRRVTYMRFFLGCCEDVLRPARAAVKAEA